MMLFKKWSIILCVGICQLVFLTGNLWAFDKEYLELEVNAILGETYDDNITYAHSGQVEDFITDTGLGVSMEYLEKRRFWKVYGDIVRHSFADRNDFDNTSADIKVAFINELSKFSTIEVSDSFYYGEEPRSFEEDFGRLDGRYSFYKNNLNIKYNKNISKQINLTASYFNELYDVTRGDLQDSVLNGLGIELEYMLNSRFSLKPFYSFGLREYDPGDDVSHQDYGCESTYFFTKQLSTRLKMGYNAIDSNETGYSTTDPFIDWVLITEVDELTNTLLGFQKRSYTSGYSRDVFDQWQVSGAFVRQLFDRLAGSIGVFYGEGEYIESAVDDDLRGLKLGVIYEISKKAKATIYYSYSEVSSSDIIREYKRNSVSLGISALF